MTKKVTIRTLLILASALLLPASAFAACADIFAAAAGGGATLHAKLKAALTAAKNTPNGGFGLNMWGAIVDRDGVVCAVAFTSTNNDLNPIIPARGDQWPGSRVISMQKANTANSFSLPGFALSTANLFTAVQPGGSLFGLQESNPVSTANAYTLPSTNYGQPNDPSVGLKIGGVNVFGGGLALYRSSDGALLGAIGVSGDSSCADHNIAWKTRFALNLDNVTGGPVNGTDNIVYDINSPGNNQAIAPKSASGWGHPQCSVAATNIGNGLLTNFPVGP